MVRMDGACQLELPASEAAIRGLTVGDYVLLSGRLYTARDAVHGCLAAGESPPCNLDGAVIYHCGPIVTNDNGTWRVTAAGPTTSMREEPYMADLITRFRLRGIIGKGGMGQNTLEACRQTGCVYFHAVGGAAQVLADAIERVAAVYWQDRFGIPEAIWECVVRDFPVIVTMDTHGGNLHAAVRAASAKRLSDLLTH